VLLLDINASDRILDMCCAPGGKMVLAGLLQDSVSTLVKNKRGVEKTYWASTGTITGIDISKERILNAASLLKKYRVGKACLYWQNGLTFNAGPCYSFPDLSALRSFVESDVGRQGRILKISKQKIHHLLYASSLLRKYPCWQAAAPIYNKVSHSLYIISSLSIFFRFYSMWNVHTTAL
jgi:hypothetical protein